MGLVTIGYLAVSLRWITGPVGPSEDGENLGVFSMGSRAMRDLGIVASKGGSVQALSNGAYAHHPPLIVWATYLSETAFGVHPWTARLPTACAAVAVIWLLYGLLTDLRLGRWPAAIGTTVAVAGPMFLLYGWMPDTPMLALPFALIIARWWVRAGRDDVMVAPVSTTVVVVTAFGALAGWEFTWWCAVLVIVALWTRRREPHRWALSGLLVGGVALGLAITAAWVAWSPAGMHGLIDAFTTRAGVGASTNPTMSLRDNLTFATELTAPIVLVLLPFAAWAAIRHPRSRQFLALAAVGVAGYAAFFWQASSIHDYWNEWLVVPLAVAFAGGAATAIEYGRLRRWELRIPVALALTAVCAVWGPLMTTGAQDQLTLGARVSRDMQATTLAPGQPGWLVSELPTPRAWVSYLSGRPQQGVDSLDALAHVAIRHPDWQMVAACSDQCVPMAAGGIRVDNVVINRVGVISAVVAAHPPTS
jgi:4-amino-4-deoxy-L-arabinose transferase-like glycosyltransferase